MSSAQGAAINRSLSFPSIVKRGLALGRLPSLLAATAVLLGGGLVGTAQARTSDEAAVSASCGTTYSGRIGINSDLIWNGESAAAQQLAAIGAGGVSWVREDFPWDRIEPSPGVWNWSLPDALVTAAAQNGVNVLAILDYSAPWASSDPTGAGDQYYPPKNFAAYAAFAGAVTARYGPGGTFWGANPQLPQLPLGAEEIWNEPWFYAFWKPRPEPAAYASLALTAAQAIHAESPSMTVLAAGDLQAQPGADQPDIPWIDSVLTAQPSLANTINAWSVHPYSSPWEAGPLEDPGSSYSFSRVLTSRQVALSHSADQPFWITEFGWSTAPSTAGAVSQATQAQYVGQALQMSLADWSFVTRAFVYTWSPSTGVAGDLMGNFGVRNPDGSTKPAWATIGQMVAQGSCVGGPTVAAGTGIPSVSQAGGQVSAPSVTGSDTAGKPPGARATRKVRKRHARRAHRLPRRRRGAERRRGARR